MVKKKQPVVRKRSANRAIATGSFRLALVLGALTIPVRASHDYAAQSSVVETQWRQQVDVWTALGCASERRESELIFDQNGLTDLQSIGCSTRPLLFNAEEIRARKNKPKPRAIPAELRWASATKDGMFVFLAVVGLAGFVILLRIVYAWVISGYGGR